MTKTYRGAAERAVDRMIADGRQEIAINWIRADNSSGMEVRQ